MDSDKFVLFLISLALLIVIVSSAKACHEDMQACEKRGGALVRGVSGFVCVDKR